MGADVRLIPRNRDASFAGAGPAAPGLRSVHVGVGEYCNLMEACVQKQSCTHSPMPFGFERVPDECSAMVETLRIRSSRSRGTFGVQEWLHIVHINGGKKGKKYAPRAVAVFRVGKLKLVQRTKR